MGKLLGAWTRDYWWRIGLYIVVAAFVIPLGCLLIFVPLWIVQSANLDNTATLLILIVPIGLFFFIVIGGALAFAYRIMSRRTHWLDEAIAPLGLEGKSYALSGRQYHGTYQGRQVDILFYRGPTFSIFVGTPLQTKLSVAERSKAGMAIGRAFKREPLTTADPQLENLVIYAHEETWGQALVAQPEAAAVFNRLINGENKFLFHQLHLYPNAFLFRLYRSKKLFEFKIQPEQIQAWFSDLLKLAQIAEALPAPQEIVQASRLEQASRTGEASKWGLWIGVGIVAVLILCGFVPMVGIIALAILAD
ncbi:MAG: hypothetical protein WAM60_06600 [Candidatus Promineifilaceae bacterium]